MPNPVVDATEVDDDQDEDVADVPSDTDIPPKDGDVKRFFP